MEDKINNIKEVLNSKIKINKDKTLVNKYVVILEWDSNDADFIPKTIIFDKQEFEDDILLKLVLSYVSVYGHYIEEDKNVFGLANYFNDYDMASYNDWGMCHSINSVNIKFYDENGVVSTVILPNFKDLFPNQKDGYEILNHCLTDEL